MLQEQQSQLSQPLRVSQRPKQKKMYVVDSDTGSEDDEEPPSSSERSATHDGLPLRKTQQMPSHNEADSGALVLSARVRCTPKM